MPRHKGAQGKGLFLLQEDGKKVMTAGEIFLIAFMLTATVSLFDRENRWYAVLSLIVFLIWAVISVLAASTWAPL